MQQPYGGYGMQSPYGGYGAPQQGYGGYSPYGMPSQYGPQPSYGMPQQQTMMAAPQVATQEGAAAGGDVAATSDVTPAGTFDDAMKNLTIGGNTTQTNRFDPWGPQQEQLRRYLTGTTGRIVDGKAEEISAAGLGTKGAMSILYEQQQAGPLGFDPQSEAALKRMQADVDGRQSDGRMPQPTPPRTLLQGRPVSAPAECSRISIATPAFRTCRNTATCTSTLA